MLTIPYRGALSEQSQLFFQTPHKRSAEDIEKITETVHPNDIGRIPLNIEKNRYAVGFDVHEAARNTNFLLSALGTDNHFTGVQ